MIAVDERVRVAVAVGPRRARAERDGGGRGIEEVHVEGDGRRPLLFEQHAVLTTVHHVEGVALVTLRDYVLLRRKSLLEHVRDRLKCTLQIGVSPFCR